MTDLNDVVDFIHNAHRFEDTPQKPSVVEFIEFCAEEDAGLTEDVIETFRRINGYIKGYQHIPTMDILGLSYSTEHESKYLDPLSLPANFYNTRRFIQRRVISVLSQRFQSEPDALERRKVLNRIISLEGDSLERVNIKTQADFSAQEIYDRKKATPAGLQTNIPEIDELLRGIAFGRILSIMGPPKCGKSSLIYSMCRHNAYHNGYNSVLFAFEIPKDDVYFCLLSNHSYESKFSKSLEAERIIKGELSPEEEKILYEEVEPDFQSMPGKVVLADMSDLPTKSPEGMIQYLEQTDKELDGKLDCVYLDYLQMMQYLPGRDTAMEKMNRVVGLLRESTVQFRGMENRQLITVIAVQPNREGIKYAERRMRLLPFHAANVSEVERASAYLIGLTSDEAMRHSNEMFAQVLYNRFGPVQENPITVYCDLGCTYIGSMTGYREIFTQDQFEDTLLNEMEI
ncbi:MAG TPA: hypothetical protein ENI23_15545 [bacterium]|nr:hypothetical protein [bacterium]